MLVAAKGFGYRWGPWRGSDPHTWLAPLVWSAPPAVRVPELVWEAVPGAPEVAPEFDDRAWRQIAPGAPLAMETHGLHYGLVWYRGYFAGAAGTLTVQCRHASDVFLNGTHIAALNDPPEIAPTPKTLPLPASLLRETNVVAVLVELQGRAVTWDAAAQPHGLLAATLDSGATLAWRVRGGLSGEQTVQGFAGFAAGTRLPATGAPDVTWHRARFNLTIPEMLEVPWFVFLGQTPTKAYIFLNGQLIGRYWDGRGPQQRFWLPEGILQRRGENELLIAQWTRGGAARLGIARLECGAVAQWIRQ